MRLTPLVFAACLCPTALVCNVYSPDLLPEKEPVSAGGDPLAPDSGSPKPGSVGPNDMDPGQQSPGGQAGSGGQGGNGATPPNPGDGGATPPAVGGAGGMGGVSPDGGMSAGGAPEEVDVAIVDDFEDMNKTLPLRGGRKGFWFSLGNAEDAGGSISPFIVSELSPSRGESRYGVNIVASGYAPIDTWAVFGVNFNQEMAYPGAADYRGLEFWARAGGTESSAVRVELLTTDTASAHGGDDDNFGILPELKPEWELHTVLWTDLSQGGWGMVKTFEPANLTSIQFKLKESETGFDVWLDDVKMVR